MDTSKGEKAETVKADINQYLNFQEYLDKVQEGATFFKIISKNKCLRRKYLIDADNIRLHYSPTKKFACQALPYVDLSNAISVRKGWTTDKFKFCERRARRQCHLGRKSGEEETWKEECCFSIIFPALSKTIDLVADSKDTRDAWVNALNQILEYMVEPQESTLDCESFVRSLFINADTNKNGFLSIDETKALFRSLNLYLDTPTLTQHYLEMKPGPQKSISDTKLTVDDFEKLFHCLNDRKELREIFDQYCKKGKSEWDVEDIRHFLVKEQQEAGVTQEQCQTIVDKNGQSKDTLSFQGFLKYMMSNEQMLFDWNHEKDCEDMTQPLSHYYIASSHNTYLISNQLTGMSSINAYKRVLEEGCRCIELDVWDGSYFEISEDSEMNEEPIIYHGHTLTTKILLRDVLEVIREYAFLTSKYPVILSIENHCSLEQQQVMTDYFTHILGDLLLTEPLPEHEQDWPSPEQLAYKIIIKGKKIHKPKDDVAVNPVTILEKPSEEDSKAEKSPQVELSSEASGSGVSSHTALTRLLTAEYEDEADDDEQRQSFLKKLKELNLIANKVPNPLDYTDKTNIVIDDTLLPGEQYIKIEGPNVDILNKIAKDILSKKKPKGDHGLLEALADLTVYCQARRFRTFEDAIQWNFYEMSSFSETKATSLISSSIHDFQEFNMRHMSRIYPKGTRADSSNYKPNLYWSAGCQMVALNYQNSDKSMRTNRAFFRANGRSGYILKPSNLRKQQTDNEEERLTITIISGQTILKPPKSGYTDKDIVDPYVQVELFGEPNQKKKFQTKYIKNNGFNPVWKESFEFEVKEPRLAFLQFVVKDQCIVSMVNPKLGEYLLPVFTLKRGYRHLRLQIDGEDTVSTLFVHVVRDKRHPHITPL